MVEEVIRKIKYYIDNDMEEEIIEMMEMMKTEKNKDYIFQKIFLFSCLIKDENKKEEIVKYMFEIYKNFDLITQSALRPTLIYGKYIYKGKGKGKYPIEIPKI